MNDRNEVVKALLHIYMASRGVVELLYRYRSPRIQFRSFCMRKNRETNHDPIDSSQLTEIKNILEGSFCHIRPAVESMYEMASKTIQSSIFFTLIGIRVRSVETLRKTTCGISCKAQRKEYVYLDIGNAMLSC